MKMTVRLPDTCHSDLHDIYLADSSSMKTDVENKSSDVATASDVISLDSTANSSVEEVQFITQGRLLNFSLIFNNAY